ANGLYGLFVLPESLAPEKRAPFALKNANPVSAIGGVVRDYPIMWKWLAVVVLANAAQLGVNSIYTVYVTYRYSWQPADLSVYLSYFGFLSIFLQAAVVPFMSRQFQEWTLLIVGAVLNS